MAIQSDGSAMKAPRVVKLVVALSKREVTKHFGLNITSKCRKREYIRARLIFYLSCREAFPEGRLRTYYPTYSYLGYSCGKRDHASVFHAVNKCTDLLTRTDEIFLEALTKKLSKFRYDFMSRKIYGFNRVALNRDERKAMISKLIRERTLLDHKESYLLATQLLELTLGQNEQDNKTN